MKIVLAHMRRLIFRGARAGASRAVEECPKISVNSNMASKRSSGVKNDTAIDVGGSIFCFLGGGAKAYIQKIWEGY